MSACDKAPLLAPGGTVIYLTATASSVSAAGSIEILAVLLEQGAPPSTGTGTTTTTTPASGTPVHNGTLVSFTSTIGRIEPAEARTTNGQVRVTFIGDGRSGAAKILAYSGGARTELSLNVGAAAAERVNVTSTSLGSSGGSSVIRATVEDTSGNPLAGVPVQFSATRGTLSATSAITNSAGVATVTLSTTAEATVTVTVGSKTSSVPVTLSTRSGLTITPPTTITASSPATFNFGVASGASVANVRVNFGDGSVRDL
ncbi:MAG: Ig-like domain-containing protein, partial [Acidobacteriota bacterium]|nr:Ig-like domain-containing protein [Acidobacteriota bacterium]